MKYVASAILIGKKFCDESYQRLRQALLSMIDLVESIDLRTDALAENSVRLQKYMERIDLIQQTHNAAATNIDEHPGPPPATFSSCTAEHEEAGDLEAAEEGEEGRHGGGQDDGLREGCVARGWSEEGAALRERVGLE